MTTRTKTFPAHFKAADDGTGTFEAIVAVFGNVDYQGDRIVAGAFADTLADWKAAGDPIPVIYSHQWHDLNAHIGEVSATDAKELLPGDDLLPDSLKDLGGLYVKGTLDVDDDPIAAKAHRKMQRRLIREFSFAYDIRDDGEKRGSDGVNELLSLDLIEVGPTLKGANPATALIDAKALEAAGIDGDTIDLDALAKAVNTALNPPTPDGGKAQVDLADAANSIEAHLSAIANEVRSWALDLYNDDLYFANVEATFPDHVLAYVELWEEPLHGGTFYRIPYSVAGDTITLAEPEAVVLELTISPKSFEVAPRVKASPADPATPNPKADAPDPEPPADPVEEAPAGLSLEDARLISNVRAQLYESSSD